MMTTTHRGMSTRPARIPVGVLAADRTAARRHLDSLVLGWTCEDVDRMVLPRIREAASAARKFASAAGAAWHIEGDRLAALRLVASELVTNAIRHATPPVDGEDTIVLELSRRGRDVLVAVTDADPTLPTGQPLPAQDQVLDPDQDTGTHGAGMAIVHAYAAAAGTTPTPAGKTVWAIVGAASDQR